MAADGRASQRYDRAYFDHWYRDEGFDDPGRLDRKVGYALSAAEYLLERPVTSVLDVGCGEGVWSEAIAARRQDARYVGVDPSEYAVGRFGRSRGLHQLGIGELDGAELDAEGRFDLIVCVDVIAYVAADELRRGLRSMARMLAGVAFIEVFTDADEFVGDRDHYHARPPATYDRWFTEVGLHRIGPHLYAGAGLLPSLATFEQR